jgi:hypothetical protein
MHVSAQTVQQWICEWLLTSAVIYAIQCAWSMASDPLDIHKNLVANTRSKQSAMRRSEDFQDHLGGLVDRWWRIYAQLIQRPAAE